MIELSEKEYQLISDFIQNNYGIKLGENKKNLINGRLQRLLAEYNMNSFTEYFHFVLSDKTGAALDEMVNRITTNYTYFMREESHFKYLQEIVLPYLVKTVKNNEIRIWCAGCSSGEEAYTLAMIVDEYLKDYPSLTAKILATDISDRALELAKKGEYLNTSLTVLPAKWRNEYFNKLDKEKSVVNDKIKSIIRIGYFNLMTEDFPFTKKFHVIFCRNVMIYFDSQNRDKLVDRFYDALEPGCYLFTGHSEALNRDKIRFNFIKPAIYRKEL